MSQTDQETEADVVALLAHIDRFIEKGYGQRCPEHQDGCPVCEMWKYRDWFKDYTAP